MKLLLAEDDQMLSKVLVTLLNKNNYSVDVAFNSHDALTHLKTTIYDGAILDIMITTIENNSYIFEKIKTED